MKIAAFLSIMYIGLLACTGDCLTCHPGLLPTIEQDERHKPMMGCIECHSPDPNAMADCGSDCFACHPVEKIEKVPVEAHRVIRDCRDCHMKMQEELFGARPETGQSRQPDLKEFLLN
jgi:formate-dependent nitrite reductase cytochrome c552 subunit